MVVSVLPTVRRSGSNDQAPDGHGQTTKYPDHDHLNVLVGSKRHDSLPNLKLGAIVIMSSACSDPVKKDWRLCFR